MSTGPEFPARPGPARIWLDPLTYRYTSIYMYFYIYIKYIYINIKI